MFIDDGKMLVNDGKMLVNDGEMSIWSYTHFNIINDHFTIINEHFSSISLKYIIRSSYHHWEAAQTVRGAIKKVLLGEISAKKVR